MQDNSTSCRKCCGATYNELLSRRVIVTRILTELTIFSYSRSGSNILRYLRERLVHKSAAASIIQRRRRPSVEIFTRRQFNGSIMTAIGAVVAQGSTSFASKRINQFSLNLLGFVVCCCDYTHSISHSHAVYADAHDYSNSLSVG